MTRNRSMQTSSTSQARRHLQQREKILTIAARLFSQKGYLGTTIDDIAAAAHINKATVYYYFDDKAHLLYENASKNLTDITESINVIVDSDLSPNEKLAQMIASHIKWRLTNIGLANEKQMRHMSSKQLKTYVGMRNEYEALFRKVVTEVIGASEDKRKDPKLITRFLFGLMNSLNLWYKPKGSLSIDELISRVSEFIFDAINIRDKVKVQSR